MKAKIKFNPAVTFEGKEYTELDFSELSGWSSLRYAQAEIKYKKMFPNAGDTGRLMEAQPEFAWFIGYEVTGLPIEFFQSLNPKQVKGITNIIGYFFFATAADYAEMVELEE